MARAMLAAGIFAAAWLCAAAIAFEPPKSTEVPATLPAEQRSTRPAVARNDVALALQRMDAALADTVLSERAREDVHRAFDRASLKFFSGNLAAVAREVNAITARLHAKADQRAAIEWALSLKVTADPAMLILEENATVNMGIASMYAMSAATMPRTAMSLQIVDPLGKVVANRDLDFSADGGNFVNADIVIDMANGSFRPGILNVNLLMADGAVALIGCLPVVTRSPASVRENVRESLATTEFADDRLVESLRILESRADLLTKSPAVASNARLVIDPQILAEEVTAECAQMVAGRDPYADLRGRDLWMALPMNDAFKIPVRMHVPENLASDVKPALVIALHGAGGDENLFWESYGRGRINQLADQHGFVMVSPLAYRFDDEAFDMLVNMLVRRAGIDERRVYVIGHSMGAGVASSLAGRRNDRIAAVACIAGSGALRVTPMVPVLVIGAENDRIVPATALRTGVQAAKAAGQPVEFRMISRAGHTLVVGEVLPEVVQWLLSHDSDGPNP